MSDRKRVPPPVSPSAPSMSAEMAARIAEFLKQTENIFDDSDPSVSSDRRVVANDDEETKDG